MASPAWRGNPMRVSAMQNIGVVVLLLATPVESMAQSVAPRVVGVDDESLPEDYKRAFQRGSEEMQRGKFVEARASFQRAHKLYPSARSLRALGKVEFELDNYLASVRYLDAALQSEVRPLTPAMRKETARLKEIARDLVTRLHLVLDPSAARVYLDGSAVELDERNRILVVVGKHDLMVHAPGFITSQRKLDLQSGAETRIKISLLPTPSTRTDSTAFYERWWFWTVAGVVAAGAVVTAIVLASRDPYAEPTKIDGPIILTLSEAK